MSCHARVVGGWVGGRWWCVVVVVCVWCVCGGGGVGGGGGGGGQAGVRCWAREGGGWSGPRRAARFLGGPAGRAPSCTPPHHETCPPPHRHHHHPTIHTHTHPTTHTPPPPPHLQEAIQVESGAAAQLGVACAPRKVGKPFLLASSHVVAVPTCRFGGRVGKTTGRRADTGQRPEQRRADTGLLCLHATPGHACT